MDTRPCWKPGSIVVAAACLLTILSSILGSVAVRQRVVAPPDLDARLGAFRIVAYTTDFPECPWPARDTCYLDQTLGAQDFYTVWVFVGTEPLRTISRPVLSVPIDR